MEPRQARGMSNPTGTQAVDRAACLLVRIVDAPEPVAFSDLVVGAGLVKSTAFRLLQALERNRLIDRTESGKYKPGEVFVRYAWRSEGDADLVQLARPFLERLAEATNETINLGVFSRGSIEQIAQVDSPHLLGATNWVGRPVPVHCSASGKVLLAFGAAELGSGKLERRTQNTLTSRAALNSELTQIRSTGFAISDEELEDGLVAVAAPIFGDSSVAIAALSVSGPVNRLSVARMVEVAGACVKEAAALSLLLGRRNGKIGAA